MNATFYLDYFNREKNVVLQKVVLKNHTRGGVARHNFNGDSILNKPYQAISVLIVSLFYL